MYFQVNLLAKAYSSTVTESYLLLSTLAYDVQQYYVMQ